MNRLDNAIAGTHLGQKSEYAEQYDRTLLVAVPRQPNRDSIGVQGGHGNTPWKYAADIWNCYEVSSLLANGQPFSAVAKVVYDGNSDTIVESKSLKLYLNSFNQTRCRSSLVARAAEELQELIHIDLSNLLHTDVRVGMETSYHGYYPKMELREYLNTKSGYLTDFNNIDGLFGENIKVQFSKYTEDRTLLGEVYHNPEEDMGLVTAFTSNLFSRCQITNQPDHGDLFIAYRGNKYVGQENILLYVSSLRGHSCFHEPTVETIFKHLYDLLTPTHLMVGALYTRRGGISIAPFRSTHEQLMPYNLTNHLVAHVKLPRE